MIFIYYVVIDLNLLFILKWAYKLFIVVKSLFISIQVSQSKIFKTCNVSFLLTKNMCICFYVKYNASTYKT